LGRKASPSRGYTQDTAIAVSGVATLGRVAVSGKKTEDDLYQIGEGKLILKGTDSCHSTLRSLVVWCMRYCSLPSIKNSSRVSEAMDKINDRWGEFVITPALMMDMDEIILDRIAFGGVKELEEIYAK
jgi:hypothetical protein